MAKSFCMMKKLLPILALGCSALAFGQTEEPIEYFTDSDVSDTRFSFAATYAPAFASRRLALYEPQMDGEEIYALNSEGAAGILAHRYGIMSYYELSGIFHLGIGFMTEQTGFIAKQFAVIDQTTSDQQVSLGVFDAKTTIQAVTVPLQAIFHTQLNDFWALQVVPSYDLTFYQKIDREWVGDGVPDYSQDAVDGTRGRALGTMYQRGSNIKYHKGFNGTIGFALGSEFAVANNLVFTVRGEFRLAALPINKLDVGLSEVPYSVGGAFGFRYYL